ncbi:unnamed protein product [Rodentolepis nana]|uniref:C2H2-type domain-containing protein n=1 Tax=Rodentolepis nana TaxID=102285 RepID=A0A0R3TWF2_RODNA|nr:unnamed protein product [Rodentolepis nana]
MYSHNGNFPFVCQVCHKGFPTKFRLRSHDGKHGEFSMHSSISQHSEGREGESSNTPPTSMRVHRPSEPSTSHANYRADDPTDGTDTRQSPIKMALFTHSLINEPTSSSPQLASQPTPSHEEEEEEDRS